MKAKKRASISNIKKSVDPLDFKNHKIYSIVSSNAPGGGNRHKRVAIKGIPGSSFSVMVQDENKRVYDFKRGSFNGTPSPIRGVIPATGVFNITIKTGKAKSVNVNLLTATSTNAVASASSQPTEPRHVTVTAITTGLTSTHLQMRGPVTIKSPSIKQNSPGYFTFEFTIQGIAEKFVNIVRAPKFNYEKSLPSNTFVLYDGIPFAENDLAHSVNQDGREILSDFELVEAFDGSHLTTGFKISGLAFSINDELSIPEASEGHSVGVTTALTIKGRVDIGYMGTEDLTVNLRLFNFLELI